MERVKLSGRLTNVTALNVVNETSKLSIEIRSRKR